MHKKGALPFFSGSGAGDPGHWGRGGVLVLEPGVNRGGNRWGQPRVIEYDIIL